MVRPEEYKRSRKRAAWLGTQLGLDRKIEICDIGARQTQGGFPYQVLVDLDLVHLTGFEPDPEAFAILDQQKGQNQRYICAAVGKPGPATFYLHDMGVLSSVYKIRAKAAAFLDKMFWVKHEIREIPMDLVGLDSIDSLPKIDVLKMDIQGAERDVLQSGKEALSQAVVVIPEVCFYQMYEDQPMFADVDAEMRAQGFVLHKFLHQKSVMLGSSQKKRMAARRRGSQLLDGDAVYIRNLEDPEALSDDQLKVMALAADSVFGSYDLTAHCLTILSKRAAIHRSVVRKYIDRVPADWLAPVASPVTSETEKQAQA